MNRWIPSEELKARVAAHNRAQQLAAKLSTEMVGFFSEYIGIKVVKKDGSLTTNVRRYCPWITDMPGVRMHHITTHYSLSFSVEVTAHTPKRTFYQDCCITVGSLENQFLIGVGKPHIPQIKNAQRIAKLRKELDETEHKLSDLNSAIMPFGRYDR